MPEKTEFEDSFKPFICPQINDPMANHSIR
jgi:hypothetical protein